MRTRKFLSPVLVLFLLSLSVFFVHKQAAAIEPVFESSWSIHVDFEGDQPNATLTVEVWEFTGGVPTNHLVSNRPLPCYVPKSVAIVDEQAIFSGEGGIRCLMPSLRRIVFKMTDGAFILPSECDSKEGASADVEVILDFNNTAQLRLNPIFTMVDLALETPTPAFDLRPAMRFHVDEASARSQRFTADVGLNSLHAQFIQINGPDAEDLDYQPIFVANGNLLPSFPPLIEEDLAISNNQTVLYIGFSPQMGESLYGRIKTLDIDPGCYGTG